MGTLSQRISMLAAELDALRLIEERRTGARGGWFVLCDLDGFKAAQDAHHEGHAFGDRVLVEFARWLAESSRRGRTGRPADRVATRRGGDEFVVWCPTKVGARLIRNRVRKWTSRLCDVRASAGMGCNMGTADAALYINKTDRKRKSRNLLC